jgi:hypothetical protein
MGEVGEDFGKRSPAKGMVRIALTGIAVARVNGRYDWHSLEKLTHFGLRF